MPHRWADTVEPGAFIGGLRRRKGRTGQLLGVKAVIDLLRRIAPYRKRTGQRLGLKAVAETGHVALRHGRPLRTSRDRDKLVSFATIVNAVPCRERARLAAPVPRNCPRPE